MLFDNWEYNTVNNYDKLGRYVFSLQRCPSFKNLIKTKYYYDGQTFFNFDFEFAEDDRIDLFVRSSTAVYGHMIPPLKNTLWKGHIRMGQLAGLEIIDERLTALVAEDPRLFTYKNQKYMLVHNVVNPMTMILYNVDEEYLTIVKDPLNRSKTKNWIPYVDGDSLKFVTDIMPTRILDVKTKNLEEYNQGGTFRVSGSSRMFELDGVKTAIVHGWTTDLGQNRFGWPHKYWNAVAQWDDMWNLRIYDAFYMADDFSVEFSTGIQIKDNKVFFGYSVLDREICISSISIEDFKNYCLH